MVRSLTGIITVAVLVLAAAAHASYKDDIGFTQLHNERGLLAPTGSGINVSMIEGIFNGGYAPDPGHAEYNSKTLTLQSGPTGVSSHAHDVARRFFGNTSGIAPGVTSIWSYELTHWLENVLNVNLSVGASNTQPAFSNRRVANHSWVADHTRRGEILRRLDYIIDNDDYLQVVGINNSSVDNSPLLGDAYNAIVVGTTSGIHPQQTTAVDTVYVAGRVKPTVVAPESLTSYAAPLVAGTVATLLQVAENPSLSNGSFISPRSGLTIQHAGTSEVIKAAIMAGADRQTSNTATASNITNFGASAAPNGLDYRYGAGQVNLYNAVRILEGGEQEAGGFIGQRGFDFRSSFANSDVAEYFFTGQDEVSASLVWNARVNPGTGNWDGTTTLANFNLYLYEVLAGPDLLIASSESAIDNTENLLNIALDASRTYKLLVSRVDNLGTWDYALAWNMIPEPGTLTLLSLAGLLLLRRRSRPL